MIEGLSLPPHAGIDLPANILKYYSFMKVLPDGRICGTFRLLFHYSLQVDLNEYGYEDIYCYDHLAVAALALVAWDGTGDPIGWIRHPRTGRRADLSIGEIRVDP